MKTDEVRLAAFLAGVAGGVMLLAGSFEHAVLAFLVGCAIVRQGRS